jgi:hypothetical protein
MKERALAVRYRQRNYAGFARKVMSLHELD